LFIYIASEKLLRKFLVRDPLKRGALDILNDDPWLNEGYEDSPVLVDKSEVFVEDEEIVKLVEQKFKIEKEVILKSLRDGVYDDISALYYLYYYDKDARTRSSSETPDIVQVTNTRPKEKSVTPAMGKIEEDSVLTSTIAPANQEPPKAAAKPRRRRATVTANGATDESEEESSNEGFAFAGNEKSPANRPQTAVTTESSKEQSPVTVAPAKPDVRKRTNTIVGIFKRKTEESQAPTSPVAEDAEKPRSLRFTFNSNTTSSKSPDEIMTEILRFLNQKRINFHLSAKYLIECNHEDEKEPVKFEIEVCKLPRLNNLHGVRFKRLSGSSESYKEICEIILSSVKL
jgi:MAP/microtubule affinity-regulating kinase